jgi:hypothetical protein
MLEQRERLRIVHDDKIVIEKIAHAVLVNHLLEDLFLDPGKIDFSSLKSIVHLLRDGEKIRGSLNHSPLGAKAKAVHKQRERGDRLGHSTAVVGGIEIRDAQAF